MGLLTIWSNLLHDPSPWACLRPVRGSGRLSRHGWACVFTLAMSALPCAPTLAREGMTIKPPLSPTSQNLVGKTVRGMSITPQDVKFMEPVCALIIANDSGEIDNHWWNRLDYSGLLDRPQYVIARGVRSFHHYCWAQIFHGRVYGARNEQQRQAFAHQAIADYRYLISHKEYLPPGWPYLPKMLVALGAVLALSDDEAEASAAYLKAIEIDSTYAQAYLGIAEVMLEKDRKDKAMEFVIEGLRHKPDSKPLKKRYVALGGKLPYPTPITAVAKAETAQPAVAPGAGQVEPAKTPPPHVPAASDAVTPAPAANQNAQVEPARPARTKVDPYCRFCP